MNWKPINMVHRLSFASERPLEIEDFWMPIFELYSDMSGFLSVFEAPSFEMSLRTMAYILPIFRWFY